MRFDPSNCPSCGEQATGLLETIPGIAFLLFDENGDAQYAGETDVCWDNQTTVRDRLGHVMLVCPDEHQWPASLPDATTAVPEGSLCSFDLAIDGALLQAQRRRLMELMDALQRGKRMQLDLYDQNLLEGLINLTDEIADQAADRYGIDSLLSNTKLQSQEDNPE
jgi:hypothetical protein